MNTKQFVIRHGIKMSAELVDQNPLNPDWMDATHWKIRLRCGNRQMTTYFSQGYAYTGEPEVASVLDCLALDASSIENAGSFEEWADELGFDTDSRKAETVYKATKKNSASLERLLGTNDYHTLLYRVERM